MRVSDSTTHPRDLILDHERLIGEGETDYSIRRLLASGELIRVRPGAFVRKDDRGRFAHDRHLIALHAGDIPAGTVLSHQSAAVLHGLPVYRAALDAVHLTRPSGHGGSRRSRHRRTHFAPVPDADIAMVDGVPVTGVARTLLDLCRTTSRITAVCAIDAALHLGWVSSEELAGQLERCHTRWGLPRARLALAAADGRSESVGETRSRLLFADTGLPAPELQREFFVDGQRFRVDFYWERARLVGEFDGISKYVEKAERGRLESHLRYEKARASRLMATGVGYLDWQWSDLDDPRWLLGELRRRLSSA